MEGSLGSPSYSGSAVGVQEFEVTLGNMVKRFTKRVAGYPVSQAGNHFGGDRWPRLFRPAKAGGSQDQEVEVKLKVPKCSSGRA